MRNRRFRLDDIRSRVLPTPRLQSGYIPTVWPIKWLAGAELHSVAVPVKRVISPKELSTGRGEGIRAKLRLPRLNSTILLCAAKDPLLEDIDRDRDRVLPALAGLGFDLIAAPGFSVYDDDFPPETLNNQTRSLIAFETLQAAGAVAAPHVAWADDAEMYRIVRWLHHNPAVTLVWLDLQSPGYSEGWESLLPSLERFAKAAPGGLRYLINGVATATKVSQLRGILPSFYLTNLEAFIMACHGQETFGDVQARSTAGRLAIFLNFVDYFTRLLSDPNPEAVEYVPAGQPVMDAPLFRHDILGIAAPSAAGPPAGAVTAGRRGVG